MAPRVTITESELLDELRAATRTLPSNPEGAFTFSELREAMGISILALTRKLRALKAAGKMECVRVVREALDGRAAQVPAYRLIGKGKRVR